MGCSSALGMVLRQIGRSSAARRRRRPRRCRTVAPSSPRAYSPTARITLIASSPRPERARARGGDLALRKRLEVRGIDDRLGRVVLADRERALHQVRMVAAQIHRADRAHAADATLPASRCAETPTPMPPPGRWARHRARPGAADSPLRARARQRVRGHAGSARAGASEDTTVAGECGPEEGRKQAPAYRRMRPCWLDVGQSERHDRSPAGALSTAERLAATRRGPRLRSSPTGEQLQTTGKLPRLQACWRSVVATAPHRLEGP